METKGLKLNNKHSVRNDAIYNSCLDEVVSSLRRDTNHFRTSGIDNDTFRYGRRMTYEEDMVYLQSRYLFCGQYCSNGMLKTRVFLV